MMGQDCYIGILAHAHTTRFTVLQELIERGHDVLYYSTARFRQKAALPAPRP
jgi:UDP:flavonoid glycosyltransferase YjiC (YdhE family)